MSNHEIVKVLSNNVVLVTDKSTNYVLVGNGIGFGKKKGQFITDDQTIEQTFISLDQLNANEQKTLLNEVDTKLFEVTNQIVILAKETLREELNTKIHLGLIDHINFAIKRLKDGIDIVNPFLEETQILYPNEYKIAQKAVDIISREFKIDIPDAEIGFIALHIYGNRENNTKAEAMELTQLIKNITDLVQIRMDIDLNKNTYVYSRFVVHLKALIDRVMKDEVVENNIIDKIIDRLDFELSLARMIAMMMEKTLSKEVPEDEVGYIALHLSRLHTSKNIK